MQEWWKNAVMYQIYVKSFYDSNQDGIGDLQGVAQKLPYLKELGIDGIWLCPFYKSPMKDNGYDIADYYAIEPSFGTMTDMEELLKRAEELDIHIVIDMVLNHTSDQHEWFMKAKEDENSIYRDYYIFQRSDTLPSNGRSHFGGSVWEKADEHSYYFHAFDKSQPDLNWENESMRKELYDMMNYWIEKGVDGFRMDAITFIKKNYPIVDIEPDEADGTAHVCGLCMNQPGIFEYLQEMKNNTYGPRQVMTVAEAPGVPYDQLEDYIGVDGAFSMIFDFNYVDIDLEEGKPWYVKRSWSVKELKELLFESQLSVQKIGWGAVFLENHDQPRSLDKFFPADSQKSRESLYLKGSVLATLLLFLRGTPFIYQGEEIGMTNCYDFSIEDYDDINSIDQYHVALEAGKSKEVALEILHQRSRDNSRTPMQWENRENGGFSSHATWLKVNPNYEMINVKSQINSDDSLLFYYKKLIALRKSKNYADLLRDGEIKEELHQYEEIISFVRFDKKHERRLQIILHMGQNPIALSLSYKACLSTNYENMLMEERKVIIRKYEALILEV